MLETESISVRLARLADYVRDLSSAQPGSLREFEDDKMLRRYVERMLHMAIEATIAIALHILVDEGLRSPDNYHDIFIVLGEKGILPPPLVASMTDLIEFRNVLVHQPEFMDPTVVYGVLKRRLDSFEEFRLAVEAYLRGEPMPVPAPLGEGDD